MGILSFSTARKMLLPLLLATLVFDRLFWQRDIGLNLSLFAALIMGLVLLDKRWRGLSRGARAAGAGTLIAACMLVLYGSVSATVAVCGGLFVFSGLAHAAELRTAVCGGLEWALHAARSPLTLARSVGDAIGDRPVKYRGRRWAGLVVVPVLVATVFFFLYRGANSRFEAMTANLFGSFGQWTADFLEEIFTPHALFFGFGLLVCSSLLLRNGSFGLVGYERGLEDRLVRRRRSRPHWEPPTPMNALDRERRRGVLLLLLVNALLLVVNAIDIHWVWFGFEVPTDFSLKEFVHEGTWLLIISILLSMGILLHLFRGNLNFHPHNRLLRTLAIIWVAQNFVLGISVFLRNYHYIAFHGLAYKRIGVIVFLLLVLVGLITLYLKIRGRLTFFYLVRVNSWAAFTAMIALSVVDWDGLIARYNLHHWNTGQIDVDNYLTLSDRELPVLYEELDAVHAQIAKHRTNEVQWITHLDPAAFDRDLDARRRRFLEQQDHRHWQSWTWADQRTRTALAERHLDAH